MTAAKRKETPDVLGEILGEIPAAPPPAKAEEKPVGQHTSKTASQQAGKPTRQPDRKPAPPPSKAEEPKVKATFYLSPGALDALEDGWLQLRRMAGQQQRSQISRSVIVELCLLAALEELKSKDTESHLATMLASQQDSRPRKPPK